MGELGKDWLRGVVFFPKSLVSFHELHKSTGYLAHAALWNGTTKGPCWLCLHSLSPHFSLSDISPNGSPLAVYPFLVT
jgi:hypothetical protein